MQMQIFFTMKLIQISTGGNKVMKKVFMVVLTVLIGAAFVTTAFAQAKPEGKPADKPAAAASEKAQAPEKKAAPKAKTFKGEFVSMDAAAKTIVAKDAKGEMTFDIAGVKKMAEFKAGDKVMVAYTERDGKMVAKAVAKQAAKK